jgi:hypothetical protein
MHATTTHQDLQDLLSADHSFLQQRNLQQFLKNLKLTTKEKIKSLTTNKGQGREMIKTKLQTSLHLLHGQDLGI